MANSAKSENFKKQSGVGNSKRQHNFAYLHGESSSIINSVVSNKLCHTNCLSRLWLRASCKVVDTYLLSLKLHFSHFLSTYSVILRYHNDSIVDFQRGGMNLENEKTSEGTTSRLLLTKANFKDSGNYSCTAQISTSQSSSDASSTTSSPMMIKPDSITVRVVER